MIDNREQSVWINENGDWYRSVGAGELEQKSKTHGTDRNHLDGRVGVVPEVIEAEAERR